MCDEQVYAPSANAHSTETENEAKEADEEKEELKSCRFEIIYFFFRSSL